MKASSKETLKSYGNNFLSYVSTHLSIKEFKKSSWSECLLKSIWKKLASNVLYEYLFQGKLNY